MASRDAMQDSSRGSPRDARRGPDTNAEALLASLPADPEATLPERLLASLPVTVTDPNVSLDAIPRDPLVADPSALLAELPTSDPDE